MKFIINRTQNKYMATTQKCSLKKLKDVFTTLSTFGRNSNDFWPQLFSLKAIKKATWSRPKRWLMVG